jgi:hypothetical protein
MSEEYSVEQVDQMYSEAMSGEQSSAIPMETPVPDQTGIEQPAEGSVEQPLDDQPASEPMHTIKWGGEDKEFPLSKVINYAQQGYDYSQNMHQLNTRIREIDQKEATLAEKESGLSERMDYIKQVDDYAVQNPQWWDHVSQAFSNATGIQEPGVQQAMNLQQEQNPLVRDLTTQLTGLQAQVKELLDSNNTKVQQEQDSKFEKQVTELKGKYDQFDWETPDDNGHYLEDRILQHGVDNKIASFQASLRDYLHDQILEKAQERAKMKVGASIKNGTKNGTTSKQPTTSPIFQRADTSKSYENLAAEALAELDKGLI